MKTWHSNILGKNTNSIQKTHVTLLTFNGEDFEVYKSINDKNETFCISIEGYLGLPEIKEFINLYEDFLNRFFCYLDENKYVRKEKTSAWKTIHRQRAIEICKTDSMYWIFLDGYQSHDIWDLYDYMSDVINQLREIDRRGIAI